MLRAQVWMLLEPYLVLSFFPIEADCVRKVIKTLLTEPTRQHSAELPILSHSGKIDGALSGSRIRGGYDIENQSDSGEVRPVSH